MILCIDERDTTENALQWLDAAILEKSEYITEPKRWCITKEPATTVDTNTFTQLYAVVSKKKRKKRKKRKIETTTSVLQKLHDRLMVIANWHRCIVYLNTCACIHKYIDTRMYTFDAKTHRNWMKKLPRKEKKKKKRSCHGLTKKKKKKVRSSWAFWYCKSKYRHGKHL